MPDTSRPKPDAQVFTAGQAAKLIGCSLNHVHRLFDRGKLRGYRIPGSNHRRIPRAALVRFLKEYSVPIPDWLEDS